MTEIFISYRRSESEKQAKAIYKALSSFYGSECIYLDTENNEWGDNWKENIDKALQSCVVMIVLIGKKWLEEINERERNKKPDFVRYEITQALNNKYIKIYSVLIDTARIPDTAELPEDLRDLPNRQITDMNFPLENMDEAGHSFLLRFHKRYKKIIQSKKLDPISTEILQEIMRFPTNEAREDYIYNKFTLPPQELTVDDVVIIIKYLETFGFISKLEPKILKLTEAGLEYLKLQAYVKN